MKYNSIGEYFYKLSNRCLALILLPILTILSTYLVLLYFNRSTFLFNWDWPTWKIMILEVGIIMALLSFVMVMVIAKLKRLAPEPSLGKRLSGYISIVMLRSWSFSFMLLTIGLITFMTSDLIFLYPLPGVALLFLIYWPSPARMSTDLRLKPEERDIIRNKRLGV